MSLTAFKSGTDIRGFGAEEFSNEATFLSDAVVCAISYAFTQWLSEKTGKSIWNYIFIGNCCILVIFGIFLQNFTKFAKNSCSYAGIKQKQNEYKNMNTTCVNKMKIKATLITWND